MLPVTKKTSHPITGHELPQALCGTIAPLFTPERLDGKIDFDGLEAQTDFLCGKSSVSSIIVRSGEGRMWSFNKEEVRDALRCVFSVAKDRKPVIACTAGIWDRDQGDRPRPAVYFRHAVDLSQWALAAGAVAVLQPVPAMLPPGYDYGPQDVVLRYFEDLARAVNGPILIYNSPDLSPEYRLSAASVARLSKLSQIVGVLYWTSDVSLLADMIRLSKEKFIVAAANDAPMAAALMSGVSAGGGALATLLPEIVHAAWRALAERDLPFAWRAQKDLLRAQQILANWTAGDIGCAILAKQGIRMASRSRLGGRPPLPAETEQVFREINYLKAAYL